MNKERKVIETNAIVVFDEDVRSSKLNGLLKDFQGHVIINGNLYIDGYLNVRCNLYVAENINCSYDSNIHIIGNLYCDGDIDCFDIFTSENLFCNSINSADIKVGGNLLCENAIEAYGYVVTVAGDLECNTAEMENLYVLGKMHVKGRIEADSIMVG